MERGYSGVRIKVETGKSLLRAHSYSAGGQATQQLPFPRNKPGCRNVNIGSIS